MSLPVKNKTGNLYMIDNHNDMLVTVITKLLQQY
jgi:hypothetical protein